MVDATNKDGQGDWVDGDPEALLGASQALLRLVTLAEKRGARRSRRIVQFLVSVSNSDVVVWPARDMQADEVAISDDMLLCLNALRWERQALLTLIPDGENRIMKLIAEWRETRGRQSDA